MPVTITSPARLSFPLRSSCPLIGVAIPQRPFRVLSPCRPSPGGSPRSDRREIRDSPRSEAAGAAGAVGATGRIATEGGFQLLELLILCVGKEFGQLVAAPFWSSCSCFRCCGVAFNLICTASAMIWPGCAGVADGSLNCFFCASVRSLSSLSSASSETRRVLLLAGQLERVLQGRRHELAGPGSRRRGRGGIAAGEAVCGLELLPLLGRRGSFPIDRPHPFAVRSIPFFAPRRVSTYSAPLGMIWPGRGEETPPPEPEPRGPSRNCLA